MHPLQFPGSLAKGKVSELFLGALEKQKQKNVPTWRREGAGLCVVHGHVLSHSVACGKAQSQHVHADGVDRLRYVNLQVLRFGTRSGPADPA